MGKNHASQYANFGSLHFFVSFVLSILFCGKVTRQSKNENYTFTSKNYNLYANE